MVWYIAGKFKIYVYLGWKVKGTWQWGGFSGVSFFDYEYLHEFEAKIGTARKVV